MSTTSKVLCANNAVGNLQGWHSAAVTLFTLAGSQGDKFPSITDGNCFYLTVEDTFGNYEVVKVTARIGDTLTVVRAQSGTMAREWANNTEVSIRPTAELFDDKVDLKLHTADMATKVDRNGSSTLTGALTFQNTATITASDGTNSTSLSINASGFPTIGGVSIALLPYPVGSIFCATVSDNPATLLGGGTWVRIGEGKCLIDAGTTYTAGSTGGSATHTLTTSEMPSHAHTGSTGYEGSHAHTRGSMNITGSFVAVYSGNPVSGAFYKTGTGHTKQYGDSDGQAITFDASRSWTGETSSAGSHTHTVTVQNSGGDQAMNIMNPYLAVYMWKRTA